MLAFTKSKAARTILALVIGVIALGGAFYGGRVYQNNADQHLFAAYNPPRTNTSGTGGGALGAGFGGGGGGSRNAQISAALSVGNPPDSSASAPPTSDQSAPPASGQSAPPASGQSAPSAPGQSAAAAGGQRPVTGQWVSVGHGSLTIQTLQGMMVTVPTTAATHYFQAAAAAAASLAVGERVTVSPDPTNASAAADVTLAPSAHVYVRVRSFGGGGGGGFAGGGGGGGGGFAGGGGGFRARTVPAGTITALHTGAITIKTTQGAVKTYTLTASTNVYSVREVTSGRFTAGSMTSVQEATIGGRPVAADVVQSAVAGTLASFVS